MPIKSEIWDVYVKDINVYDLVTENFHRFLDNTAIIESETGASATYRELKDRANSAACWLQSHGCIKNDIILITVPNGIDYAALFLAATKIGAIVTGCDSNYKQYEIKDRLDDCHPKFIIATTDYYKTTIKPTVKQLPVTVIVTDADKVESGCIPLSQLYSFCAKNPEFTLNRPYMVPREDLAILPYSSGTTGKPKGVMLTHYNVVFALQLLSGGPFNVVGYTEPLICCLPFFHVFGQSLLLHGLHVGARLITMQRFHKDLFLKNIQNHKAKAIYAVPPILVMLSKDPEVSNYDLSSLQIIHAGAAPVGKALTEDVKARLPNLQYLMQGYGMTECSLASHMTLPVPDMPYGSIGCVINNYEAMIVDTSTGKELGPLENGELWIRSLGIMKGYWNRPEETAATIDEHGWLHTGDIGHYDEDHHFFIVDRLKELIKVKGFQVAPAELEDLILSIPGVSDVGVIGIPNERTGELPKAFVTCKTDNKGKDLTARNVKQFIQDKVASHKHLAEVEFVESIPKSPSGKILRRQLRDFQKSAQKNQSKL